MHYTNKSEGPSMRPGPTGTGGAVALDIEAINLVEPPDLDFQSPDHWSVFCVPLGHRPAGDTNVQTRVLFRRGSTACDELELIERVTDWIRERNPDRIVTYNGASYDFPILRHRAGVTAHECPGSHTAGTDLELVLDAVEHTDLFREVKEDAGYNVPLDSALDYHDIPTPDVQLDGEEVSGADMPDLGLRMLAGDATDHERAAVKEYAESDVEPLFRLLDSLSE
ncbi:DNA polymerase protein [Halorhabdus tiamatea SARL4B]|uniref:DNA polymerase protein n=3 Tax=Halorhabdus TaxID=146825 RepID=U2F949_9EURY|nr:DNA polymerase protein [Halorhabdus tiamatea SARL4B]